MTPGLMAALNSVRAHRGFEPNICIKAKTLLLNDYCAKTGVNACVVGLSGGIDSAVTLALTVKAAAQPDSPIQRVIAALIPAREVEGATNQSFALNQGLEIVKAFSVEHVVLDIADTIGVLRRSVENGIDIKGDAWAEGQLISYLRTPTLYYLATLVTKEGLNCMVVGTTNRDEGGYLGFFGKASDGMVDLQLISDLHKSEIRSLSEFLRVPESVRAATPTGDVFDGATHLQMIGTPYDFVELYTHYHNLPNSDQRELLRVWTEEDRHQFNEWAGRIESMHDKNRHKYIGGSPSVHLDVYERRVNDGWRVEPFGRKTPNRNSHSFVGEFSLDPSIVDALRKSAPADLKKETIGDFGESAFLIHNILPPTLCEELSAFVCRQPLVPVGLNGRRADFDVDKDPVGSYRATAYSEEFSKLLWERLNKHIPSIRLMNEFTPTDWNDHRVWRASGINPALRFIVYKQGGSLIPHYDAGYDFGDSRRHTLMSLLIYLSEGDNQEGGATRLLLDQQRYLPIKERDFSDWNHGPRPHEILASIQPSLGSALLIDHRVLHDVETWMGTRNRIVLRTDIIFERCGYQPVSLIGKGVSTSPLQLWQKVGLSPTASRPEVDVAFQEAISYASTEQALTLKKDWKILRDPFYSSAYNLLGTVEQTLDAGFFNDSGEPDVTDDLRSDPTWLVTPFHKITRRLANAPSNTSLLVLVANGAFCPIHPGHMALLEIAKHELEKRGEYVLGGYISPSHDEYVASKCGSSRLTATLRVEACHIAVEASDWLMTDPWESLHTNRSLNFSEVIIRLEKYLSTHIPTHRPIQVVFVMGGDNARFALTFVGRGRCLCVLRPGYEHEFKRIANHPLVIGNPRIIMAEEFVPGNLSSTLIRSKNTHNSQREDNLPKTVQMTLRYEGNWALEHWSIGRRREDLCKAYQNFADKVREALELACRYYKNAASIDVRLIQLDNQQSEALKFRERTPLLSPLLSIDPCVEGDFNLGVSRLFWAVDTTRLPDLVPRPGWPSLNEQLKNLPAGKYILVDDDIATGKTITEMTRLLPTECVIRDVVPFLSVSPHDGQNRLNDETTLTDVGDLRDFLAGSRDGGLVVCMPNGGVVRAPYALPYVRPGDRMSFPCEAEYEFSKAVWKASEEFFLSLSPAIFVQEADPAFQKLVSYLGLSDTLTLADICRWHLERLGG